MKNRLLELQDRDSDIDRDFPDTPEGRELAAFAKLLRKVFEKERKTQ